MELFHQYQSQVIAEHHHAIGGLLCMLYRGRMSRILTCLSINVHRCKYLSTHLCTKRLSNILVVAILRRYETNMFAFVMSKQIFLLISYILNRVYPMY